MKRLPILAALAATALCAIPARAADFPYNATYANGLSSVVDNQSTANSDTLRFWNAWRDKWIVPFYGNGGGKRVLFQEGDGSLKGNTVSEGMGYGMLFAVYFGDQTLFDDQYQYVKAHFDSHGLMGWKIDSIGNPVTADGGQSSATDGDEDIAVALVFASKKWGGSSRYNYGDEARQLIAAIAKWNINAGGVVNAGDWNSDQVQYAPPTQFNPSYFDPAWYRIYGDFTGNQSFWNAVISKGYAITTAASNANTGLVAHFCDANGNVYQGYTFDYTYYQYDAVRMPFRAGLDWSWFGSSDGKRIAGKIGAFYHGQLNSDRNNLAEPHVYSQRITDGTISGGFESGTFTGLAGVAAMANDNWSDGNYLYRSLVARTTYASNYNDNIDLNYFDGAWHLFSTMYESGNFPNLYGGLGGSTGVPIGQRISIQSPASGYYVSCDLNSGGLIRAAFATQVGDWEKFDVGDAGNGLVTLKSPANGYYVSANLGWNDNLQAGWSTSPGDWEKFTWVDLGGGKFALKANANGLYVSCDLNSGDALRAAWSTNIGSWETFIDPPLGPTPPASVSATAGTKSVTVSWAKAPLAGVTYTLYRGTTVAKTGLTATSWTDTGLTTGKSYSYQVAAVKNGQTGPKSNTATATAK